MPGVELFRLLEAYELKDIADMANMSERTLKRKVPWFYKGLRLPGRILLTMPGVHTYDVLMEKTGIKRKRDVIGCIQTLERKLLIREVEICRDVVRYVLDTAVNEDIKLTSEIIWICEPKNESTDAFGT